MQHEQIAFDFTAPAPAADAEVDLLVRWLLSHPGFHTARDLTAALNLSDRKIRFIASVNDDIVSGPGSPGYCHVHHCPAKTLAHIADTLCSQGRSMLDRSIRLRNRVHAIIR